MTRITLALAVALAAITVVPGCQSATTGKALTPLDHVEYALTLAGPALDTSLKVYGPQAGFTAAEVQELLAISAHLQAASQKTLALVKARQAQPPPTDAPDATPAPGPPAEPDAAAGHP